MNDLLRQVLERLCKPPTRRRAYVRGPDGKPVHDLLMVSIDLSDFSLS